jgi:hypothetical protein
MVFSSACQEEIDLASHEFKKHVYVDGGITNEQPPYAVEVYVSSPLDDPRRIPYTNCTVTIHENTGRSENLIETDPGVYKSSAGGIKGKVGNAYRIAIETPDGRRYRSDFTTMESPVGIDTVYGKVANKEQLNSVYDIKGYQFYISSRQGDSETYLLWKMKETYEYTADYEYAGMMYQGRMYEPESKDSIYRCWRTRDVPEVFAASTINLQPPKISDKPLHFVSNQSKRLQELYSLMVRQYTIDREAYNYWNDIGEQIEGGDFLNVRQPFQIQGNVYNPEDDEEAVLGYFNVASVDKKRIFINPVMELDRIKCHIKYNVLFLYRISFQNPVYFGYGPKGRGVVSEGCIDCRLEGGELEKPDFWPGH